VGIMNVVADQVDALDPDLFSFLESQTREWDRYALLALHGAMADSLGSFSYLEIGSYLGGSLQAVMRDPRCRAVTSIDPRTGSAPDDRGEATTYAHNSTEHMLGLLRTLPEVDMAKLTTFETSVESLNRSSLPTRPDYCFIDGEHTHDAVVRDARFCLEALDGAGVIAFHDYVIVGSAISTFVRESWRDISFALAFTGPNHPSSGGGVFALEIGDRGVLAHPLIRHAVGSRWHSAVWDAVNRPRKTALPFMVAWATMPAIDAFVMQVRHGFSHYVR
jgi:hypothetical protein